MPVAPGSAFRRWSSRTFDEFVYHWTAAVRGETPDGTPVDADKDEDRKVSMEEAFIYARDHDTASETPQYDSNPMELGAELSLCGQYNGECEEDDTGNLDIVVVVSCGTVTIPVRIQNAPNEVDRFGFEVTYDPSILNYTGLTRGPLGENFDFFDVFNPALGVISVGGFEAGEDKIPPGVSGDLVYLNFAIGQCEAGSKIPIDILDLKDDLTGWSASNGCFQCGYDEDINGDREITPQDALCAFEAYLSIDLTSCGIPIDEVCGDVNMDGEITPADALCIFQKYLGIPSCLD